MTEGEGQGGPGLMHGEQALSEGQGDPGLMQSGQAMSEGERQGGPRLMHSPLLQPL